MIFVRKKNIVLIHGRPRYPQSQGQIERYNQTLTSYLQKHLRDGVFASGKNWIPFLDKMIYEYNVAIHSATNNSLFNLFINRSRINTVTYPIDSTMLIRIRIILITKKFLGEGNKTKVKF